MGFIIFIIIVCFFIFLKYLNDNGFFTENETTHQEKIITPSYLPYRMKKTMMTDHERFLFNNLRIILGNYYDIYPQINLDKIFYIDCQRSSKYYLGWLRKINQKSVDFLIVEKNTQFPVFAIELDDSTHETKDRIERDKFVGEMFKRNNFSLVRFNPGHYSIEELKIVLSKYIKNY